MVCPAKEQRAFRAQIEVHMPQWDVVGRTCEQARSPISQLPSKKSICMCRWHWVVFDGIPPWTRILTVKSPRSMVWYIMRYIEWPSQIPGPSKHVWFITEVAGLCHSKSSQGLQSFHGPCNRFRKSRFFGAKLRFRIENEYVGSMYALVDLGHAKKSRVSHQF
jgi:hypothetical protein